MAMNATLTPHIYERVIYTSLEATLGAHCRILSGRLDSELPNGSQHPPRPYLNDTAYANHSPHMWRTMTMNAILGVQWLRMPPGAPDHGVPFILDEPGCSLSCSERPPRVGTATRQPTPTQIHAANTHPAHTELTLPTQTIRPICGVS